MAVYVVAQGRIENPEALARYVEQAIPTIGAHGGRIVAFDETPEVIEGAVDLPRTVIVEFQTREAFRAWYDSPEYQAILPMRLEAAPGTLIVANGLEAR
jgi:uncharacterized protein (DUF1330 family)